MFLGDFLTDDKPIKNTYEDCLSWFKENSY